jgi:RNA polymerase sigma factor (sigma-70 family)
LERGILNFCVPGDPLMSDTSAELLGRFRDGDELAAAEMFHRYLERLTVLARSRLSPKLAARTDPEDIVQSAYRSFFLGARRGQFSWRRSGDLWRILAAITLHKVYRHAKHHMAAKRAVDAESRPPLALEWFDRAVSREPTPEEALAFADELQSFMQQLDRLQRRVLELRLQGEQIADIAADTDRSERTIRRTLQLIREKLISRFGVERNE